jgi:uncharacterized protein (DUF849 family)
MEDNIVYARGRQVRSNAELVERAARLATELQRPPMLTGEARQLLGLAPA